MDSSGEIRGFGFDADLLASEPRHQLTAIGLFDTHPGRDRHVRSWLSWLIERSGVAFPGGAPVFLPLSPNWSPAVHDVVRQAVEDLGGDALVIHRPLAAAVALDLPVEEPICHLIAEISEAHIDLAIIQAGSVVQSQLVPRHDDTLIRLATNEVLRTLDPDDEMEVRAKGVYVHGWSAPRHSAAALAAIDLPLAVPVGPGLIVLNGARVMAEAVLPWLLGGR